LRINQVIEFEERKGRDKRGEEMRWTDEMWEGGGMKVNKKDNK